MRCAPLHRCRPSFRTQWTRGSDVLRAAIAAAALSLAAPAAVADDERAQAAPPGAARAPLHTLLAGLLAYTHWPSPLPRVRLCAWGQGRGIEQIASGAPLGSERRPVALQPPTAVADALRACDAVYVSASAPPAALALPRTLLGRPVLVIGEGAGFCAAGGMFCVEVDAPAPRFHANLDAIARSGLRVNPQVLRIAREQAGSGS